MTYEECMALLEAYTALVEDCCERKLPAGDRTAQARDSLGEFVASMMARGSNG